MGYNLAIFQHFGYGPSDAEESLGPPIALGMPLHITYLGALKIYMPFIDIEIENK